MSNKSNSLVSGAKFFKVKEAHGMKMKSVLLGISKTDIIKMDKKTNEILETWPLADVKRWAGSAKQFALDFGDDKYTVRTPDGDGERMSRLVSKNKPATLPRMSSPPDPNSPLWSPNDNSPPWVAPLPTPMVPPTRVVERKPRMIVEPSPVPAPATATIIEKEEPKRKRKASVSSTGTDKRSSTESIDMYSPPKDEPKKKPPHDPEEVFVKYGVQKTDGKAIVNLPKDQKKKPKSKKRESMYDYIVEEETKEVHYHIEKISGKSIINLDALKPKKKKKKLDVDEDLDEKRRLLRKILEEPTVSRQVVNVEGDENITKDHVEPTFDAFFRYLGKGEPITTDENGNELVELPEPYLEPMEKEEPEDKTKEKVDKEEVQPDYADFFKAYNEDFLNSIEAPTITRTMVPIVPIVDDEKVEEDIALDDFKPNFNAFFRNFGDLEPVDEVITKEEAEPGEMPNMEVEEPEKDEIDEEKVVKEKKIEPEIIYPVYDEFFKNYPEMLPEKEETEDKEEPKSEEVMLRRKEEEPETSKDQGEDVAARMEGGPLQNRYGSSSSAVKTMKWVSANSLQGLDPRQRRVVVPAPPEDDPLTRTKERLLKETREFHKSATKVIIITKTSKTTIKTVGGGKMSAKMVSKLISAEHFSKSESLAASKAKVEEAAEEIKSLAKEVSARAEGVNNEVSELVVNYSQELEEMLEVAIEFCELATDKLQMETVLELVKEVCIAASTLLDNARKLTEEPDKPRHKIDLAMSAKGVTNNINDFLKAVLDWPIDDNHGDGFDAQARTDDMMDTIGLKDKNKDNDTNLQRKLRDKAGDLENYWKDGDPNYKGYSYPKYKDEIYGEKK